MTAGGESDTPAEITMRCIFYSYDPVASLQAHEQRTRRGLRLTSYGNRGAREVIGISARVAGRDVSVFESESGEEIISHIVRLTHDFCRVSGPLDEHTITGRRLAPRTEPARGRVSALHKARLNEHLRGHCNGLLAPARCPILIDIFV
ncbi:hypothetical protein EVAR_29652_1 [Eumeta japonica]|uniref:Uncharacterized protein n=1 Tax=Eumeta variegata TaxID=151549 RepID=A0A4C1W941_EUMVA|nr:hypothetical protein EVAR_29652_1 [Eumeta japonica]